MTPSEKQLERSIERLFDVHAAAIASFNRRFDSLEKTMRRLSSPEARIRSGSRAGTASAGLSELEVQDRFKKQLQDPAWSAAFHPARKFAMQAARRSRVL